MTLPTMKAVVVERFGGPEVLVAKSVPRPEPGPSDVLIQVRAAGVNPLDLYRRAGYADIPRELRPALPELPFVPGVDASGVVVAVGDRVTRFAPGDEVFGLIRFPSVDNGGRAYAEYTTAPEDHLARTPARLNPLEAAAAPLVALTAQQFLFDHARVSSGDTVLVNGAGGGVGHILVQLAALAGAKVVAVASGRHRDLLNRLGVDTFVDYTVTPVEDWPRGVDFLFDSVGGPEAYRFTSVVRDGGTVMPIFYGDYRADRAITVQHNQVHSDGEQLARLAELVDAGRLHIAVDSVYPLADAADAHRRAERGHIQGKIVLRVADPV